MPTQAQIQILQKNIVNMQSLLVEYEGLKFHKNEINEQVDENINNIV